MGKWKIIFLKWKNEFISIEEIKNIFKEEYPESIDDDGNILKERYWKYFLYCNEYITKSQYDNSHNSCEEFLETYTTKNKDEMIVFGYYKEN